MKISLTDAYKVTQVDIYPNLISIEISSDFNDRFDLILPATFDSGSIRVNYALSRGIRSFNITKMSTTNLDIKIDAEFEEDIKKLEKEIDKLESDIEGLKFSINYLDKVKPSLSDTDAVDRELEHFKKLRSSYVEELLKLERELAHKKPIFETLITDRQRLYPTGYNESIRVQATGDYDAKLVFRVDSHNIQWHQYYRINLNSSTGSIEINHYLNIVQKTLLDLSGEITLHLTPIIQQNINTVLLPEIINIEDNKMDVKILAKKTREIIQYEESEEMEFRGQNALPKLEIISDLVGINIKLNTSLPSRLLPENILIDQYSVGSKMDILIIPSFYEFAILNADIVKIEKPIYNSKAELYIDDVYTSDHYIKTAMVDSDLKIPFGLLESIRVEREEIISKHDDGLLKGYKDFGYTIKVNNFNSDVKDVKIIDRIPVSKHGSLKVADIEISEQGSVSDIGIIEWELLLQANQEVELEVRYKLAFPKGTNIVRG